jgi:hypothetical protein
MAKILSSIPKQLSIAYSSALPSTVNNIKNQNSQRNSSSLTATAKIETTEEEIINWCSWNIPDSEFDCSYNGLSLLPRKLDSGFVNSISWQGVLRSILLRLEPVKVMRKHLSIALETSFDLLSGNKKGSLPRSSSSSTLTNGN